jgi:hypothetical protein
MVTKSNSPVSYCVLRSIIYYYYYFFYNCMWRTIGADERHVVSLYFPKTGEMRENKNKLAHASR